MEWFIFAVIVLGALAVDLGIFHRNPHEVRLKEAGTWTVIWITLALLFALGIYFTHGREDAVLFLTGYLVEKTLSVDNLFVFIMIFTYFSVPGKYQHRVLFWGILGAIVTRGILIALGISLIQRFAWMIYIFGAFLVLTGVKTALQKDERLEPEKNKTLKLLRRILPVTNYYSEGDFFVREGKRLLVTPLFVVLIFVEVTDIIFALDSIPAIIGITQDPFLVYTSNLFAILGLRALYFVLAGMMQMFEYLKYGVSAILVFVGAKMLLHDFHPFTPPQALGIIILILVMSVVLSLPKLKRDRA